MYNGFIRQINEVANVKMKKTKFDFGKNCFDLLRLYSAFYVMTTHIMRHVLQKEASVIFTWWNGVIMLFCISGFLVPASMERSKGVWEFLKKRVLRIIPSMWICIIVGIITAALFCGFTLNKTFAQWFTGQMFFIRDLPQPDFITNFGVGNFQGNLWTMIYTVQFYIITALIYKLLKNRKIVVWTFVLILSMAFNLAVPYLQKTLPETGRLIVSHSGMTFFYVYFMGWFIYRWREKIVPVLSRTKILCALLLILRGIYCEKTGTRLGEYQDMIMVILMCMLTIGVGYSLGKIRFKIDLSYGLYLYHMVAVDIFVQLGLVGNMGYLIMVYAVSLLLAIASHFLVDNTVAKIFKKTSGTKYSEIEKEKVYTHHA